MNTKLHALADANGRPLSFFITAGQISDYTGAAALLDDLPKAQWMLADRGYDADWFRDALQQKGIKPCIPGRKSRSLPANTTSVDTRAATASRSCSVASRIGAASPPGTTDVRLSSSPPSLWPQPSSSGSDQRVLTLEPDKHSNKEAAVRRLW
jgi:transposase